MRAFLVLWCLAVALTPLSVLAADHPDLKYDVVVVDAFFDDKAMVAELARERAPWRVDYNKNFVTLEVTLSGYNELVKAGFRVEINDRMTEHHNRVISRLPGQNRGINGFPCYRTVTETYASAAQMAADFPNLATWIDIGDSWEKNAALGGHDLQVLRITNSALTGPKPKLFVMSAVHAREYTTAELNTRFAEFLLSNYDTDPDVTWLVDHHEVHLSLQSNPDGREKAQTGLSWRKNTNQNACGTTSNLRGIDLNRNYPFAWGCCNGSSGSQCSDTYRGTAPASEPETQAIRDYVASIFPDQRADDLNAAAPSDATGIFLDVHSYSELILWPWGFTADLAPNSTALQTLGRKFAWFNDYFPEQSIGLYPTDGTTDDFAYGDLGLAAYTFELGTSFFQNCGTFENTILPDNLEALLYAAKTARAPYLMPAGPDTLAVNLSSGVIAPGTVITLAAVVDDSRFSNNNGNEPVQNIASAEYYIDIPPWGAAEMRQAFSMTAADGNFNATSEAVSAALDTTGLSNGRHLIYVRGQDSAGNWGPVSAAFLFIVDPETAPTIAGTVTAADTGLPLTASVSAGGSFNTTTAGDGSYSLLLVSGTYDVTATPDSPDYAAATASGLSAADEQDIVQNFALYPYCDVLSDDVESGNLGWSTQTPWAITTEVSNSPTHSWTDSPGGEHNNNVNASLTSPLVDVSSLQNLRLEFASLCDSEATYDFCIVEVSSNGVSWDEVARYDGLNNSFTDITIDLPQLAGATTAQVRFRFESDSSVTEDGWYVDDIRLRGAGPQCLTGDTDSDGIADGIDNCTQIANADQRDTNGDGFGNICDPDLDNNGTVNFVDLSLLQGSFFLPGDLDSDFNGDGQTNFADLAVMANFFFGSPGPAAFP